MVVVIADIQCLSIAWFRNPKRFSEEEKREIEDEA